MYTTESRSIRKSFMMIRTMRAGWARPAASPYRFDPDWPTSVEPAVVAAAPPRGKIRMSNIHPRIHTGNDNPDSGMAEGPESWSIYRVQVPLGDACSSKSWRWKKKGTIKLDALDLRSCSQLINGLSTDGH